MVLTRSMIAAAIASMHLLPSSPAPVAQTQKACGIQPPAVVVEATLLRDDVVTPSSPIEVEVVGVVLPEEVGHAVSEEVGQTAVVMPTECVDSPIASIVKELIRVGSIKKHAFEVDIGLSFRYIMEKLNDGTLDHIHMRKIKKYLVDEESRMARVLRTTERAEEEEHTMMSGPPALLLQTAVPALLVVDAEEEVAQAVGGAPGEPQKPPPKKRQKRFTTCPVLSMGYGGVECHAGSIMCSKMVEHLATHIATLTKRVNELEMAVEACKAGGGGGGGHLVIDV